MGLSGLALSATAFMVHYYSFKREVYQLVELQKDYKTFVGMLKSTVDDLQNNEQTFAAYEEFNPVNRDSNYLKKSALQFIRDSQNPHEWEAYEKLYGDEPIKAQPRNRKKKAPIKPPIKRSRRKNPQAENLEQGLRGKRDFIFKWPIDRDSFWISSIFGPRKKADKSWGFHYGVDMATAKGTPVKAAAAGTIIEARNASGYGKMVLIKHSDKYKTRYAHLDKISTKLGQQVKAGQVIGRAGDTGHIRKKGKDGTHLHFEVLVWDKQRNPMHYLV